MLKIFKNFQQKKHGQRGTKVSANKYQQKDTKTKKQKIHNFSVTRLGKKRQLPMQEPIETIMVQAQQNFDVVGRLNPIQTEIEDDRILNALIKQKNVIYRITPLGLLFPASVKNNTKQIFIMCRELNDVKKALLNDKIYGLLAIIDLSKIDNWDEIKGKST